MNARQKKRMLG